MGRRYWVTMTARLVLLLSSGPVVAQTVTGVISGRVVDPSGLAIPGALVLLIHDATGDRRQATSADTGDFVFAAVLPGRYTINVQAPGMKRFEKRNLNITASERLAVGELALEVGSISESVTVVGQGTAVQTQSQERSAVITTTQMENSMSRARDFLSLLRMLPGVVYDPPSGLGSVDMLGITQGPKMQGLRGEFNTFSVDGLFMNDLGTTDTLYNPTNMDAISEVKVLLNNYQAEYGRSGGPIVNAVTKSGTREFHGRAYIYKRHEDLNANQFFNNLNGVPKPRYRYTTGGFSIGGPVSWPGRFNSNRDKVFLFFAQETLRGDAPQALTQVTMPTALERKGDFSQSLELNGQRVAVRDPLANAPFPDGIVPLSRVNANGPKLLEVFPLPNQLDRTITRGNYNYNFQESIGSPKQHNLFRVDVNASSKIRMYFRGSIWRESNFGHRLGGGQPSPAWGLLPVDAMYNDNAGVYSLTHTISPSLVHEFSVGAHHSTEASPALHPEDLDKLNRAKLGITMRQFFPQFNPYNLVPWASFGGVPNAAAIATDNRFPKRGADTVFTFNDSLSKVWHAHTFKAGFYGERIREYEGERGTFPGSFEFGRDVNNPNDSNYAYANAVLGNFRTYSESDSRLGIQARGATLEWYVQDNWKLNKKLTLDYGLRLSYFVPDWSADGKGVNFDPARFDPAQRVRLFEPALNPQGQRVARNPLTGELLNLVFIGAIVPGFGNVVNGAVLQGTPGYSKTFQDNRGLQYGPRAGFAYDVFGDGKTAIRGGGGIFYNNRARPGEITRNPPSQFTPVIYYGNLANYINSSGVLFPSPFTAISRTGEVQTIYNFSLGVQREIGFQTVLDVAYVGTMGRHLQQARNLNAIPYGARFLPQNQDPTSGRPLLDNFFRPYVGHSDITFRENASTSNYNSLQVQANRRFASSLQFGGSWTWSKAMDYTDAEAGSVANFAPLRVWNYGKAGWDRTHVLAVNWVWELPGASRLWNNRPVRLTFDHWQISGTATFQSGAPSGIGLGTVDTTDITGGGDGARVIVLADATLPKGERTVNRYFRPDVFARPAVGERGNAPKDVVRGPGMNNWDLAVSKDFPVRERARFQFRWEMYNAFNHTQFFSMDTSTRFDVSGRQTNTRFGALVSTRDSRRMQGSLRFSF